MKDCWGAGLEGWEAGLEGREGWEGREPWGLGEIMQVSKLLKHLNCIFFVSFVFCYTNFTFLQKKILLLKPEHLSRCFSDHCCEYVNSGNSLIV